MEVNMALGIVIVVLFTSLLVLFCVLLIKLHIHKINDYNKVIYQKDLDFQKELTKTIIETQEQVLNNISQDLHDDAGQQLTFINFLIENYKLDYPDHTELLEPLSRSAYNLSESIRGISHSLNNQLLLQQDLLRAIETEANRLKKNGAITITYTCNNTRRRAFSTDEKIVIYRIFQEIINNCMKHSGASTIAITIETEPRFALHVADDGKGFDYETVKQDSASLGLSSLVSRAGIINYDVSITSGHGQGTTVSLTEKQTA